MLEHSLQNGIDLNPLKLERELMMWVIVPPKNWGAGMSNLIFLN